MFPPVHGDETLFIVEVTYAGLFQLRGVPQEHVQPLVLIEYPRLLFPFARQIVADATRQRWVPAADDRPGGFYRAV